MITKTFICDVCKKSVGETELKSLSISMKGVIAPNGYASTQTVSKDICKECLEKKGILSSVPDGQKYEDVNAKNNKSLEDKLMDILEDLGVAFAE